MGLFANIALSAAISLATFFGAYKYVPLSWFDSAPTTHNFGSTITTINGSDTISGSRTTINTNFVNLNADKIEATQTTLNSLTSASSLATVGTITAGTWNGGIIGVSWGGTGSSTLSLGQILLGNGTANVSTPVGWGTSGQFLTSNGVSAKPTWQTAAIDQTANYNWTGSNLFKTFTASSTITFNDGGSGLTETFPTTRGASSTVITENGSGALKWITPQSTVISVNGTAQSVSGTTASTTVQTVVIPANTLSTVSTFRINAVLSQLINPAFFEVDIGNGTASSSLVNMNNVSIGNFDGTLYAGSSVLESFGAFLNNNGVITSTTTISLGTTNTSAMYISFICRPSNSGSGSCSYQGISVTANRF